MKNSFFRLLLKTILASSAIASVLPRGLVSTNSTVEQSQDVNPRGASLYDTSNRHGPWPKGANGRADIPYCWQDAVTRNNEKFFDNVYAAIEKWHAKIGHLVQYHETKDSAGNPIYCTNAVGQWNYAGLGSVNIVAIFEGDDYKASVGYDPFNTEPWSFYLSLAHHVDKASTIHELGHIQGRVHEHQRPDRDRNILVNYYAVAGVAQAVAAYEKFVLHHWYQSWVAQHPGEPIPQIPQEDLNDLIAGARSVFFSNAAIQQQYGLYTLTHDLDSTRVVNRIIQPFAKPEAPYDLKSIMHYGSRAYAADPYACGRYNKAGCVMLRYVDVNDHSKGTLLIPENTEISDGDVAWTDVFYA